MVGGKLFFCQEQAQQLVDDEVAMCLILHNKQIICIIWQIRSLGFTGLSSAKPFFWQMYLLGTVAFLIDCTILWLQQQDYTPKSLIYSARRQHPKEFNLSGTWKSLQSHSLCSLKLALLDLVCFCRMANSLTLEACAYAIRYINPCKLVLSLHVYTCVWWTGGGWVIV